MSTVINIHQKRAFGGLLEEAFLGLAFLALYALVFASQARAQGFAGSESYSSGGGFYTFTTNSLTPVCAFQQDYSQGIQLALAVDDRKDGRLTEGDRIALEIYSQDNDEPATLQVADRVMSKCLWVPAGTRLWVQNQSPRAGDSYMIQLWINRKLYFTSLRVLPPPQGPFTITSSKPMFNEGVRLENGVADETDQSSPKPEHVHYRKGGGYYLLIVRPQHVIPLYRTKRAERLGWQPIHIMSSVNSDSFTPADLSLLKQEGITQMAKRIGRERRRDPHYMLSLKEARFFQRLSKISHSVAKQTLQIRGPLQLWIVGQNATNANGRLIHLRVNGKLYYASLDEFYGMRKAHTQPTAKNLFNKVTKFGPGKNPYANP